MKQPTGKLAYAYDTIAQMQERIAELEAQVAAQHEIAQDHHAQRMRDMQQSAPVPVAWMHYHPELAPEGDPWPCRIDEQDKLEEWSERPLYAQPAQCLQQSAPTAVVLQWSDVREPQTDGIRYHHVIAQSPLGKISIEWKGWKEDDGRTLMVNGEYIDTCHTVDAAKAVAQQHLQNLLDSLMSPQPAQPLQQSEAVPLSHDDICDILKIGNPMDEEKRLICLGWNAAIEGIRPLQQSAPVLANSLANRYCLCVPQMCLETDEVHEPFCKKAQPLQQSAAMPSDAEIEKLAKYWGARERSKAKVICIVRAALARWGAPQAAGQPLLQSETVPLTNEQEIAIREGSRIGHENEYFASRPQIEGIDRRNVFEAGFNRGWQAHHGITGKSEGAKP